MSIEEHKRIAELCDSKHHRMVKWEIGHIGSVLAKLKKEIELTQHDISLLNTIYRHVR